jgi:hypothetical protein
MGRGAGQILALTLAFVSGCNSESASSNPPIDPGEPIASQMQRASPNLRVDRFSNLLSFETPADMVFVSANGLSAETDSKRAHTGHASLRISGESGRLAINLPAILPGRPFPNNWTLAGAYFYSDKPASVSVWCSSAEGAVLSQNKITLTPGRWSAAMVDLSGIEQQPMPLLIFDLAGAGQVWCDDVMFVDNTQWLLGSAHSGWSVRRGGYDLICYSANEFSIRLTNVQTNPDGWKILEANDWRARFISSGKNKMLTIYRDGRSYWDGEFRPLAAKLRSDPTWSQQQNSPATIEVPESMGRVNRSTSGDANNDGYNEAKGAYQIIANGPRLEIKITPNSVPVLEPILEITALPKGNVLVTIEGRLVEQMLRLPDGTLLVQIPAKIGRPTSVDLRVE